MTWYSLYEVATGELRGHTSVLPVGLPATLAVIEHVDRMDQTARWSPASRAWDQPIPQPVLVDRLQDLASHPFAADIWTRLTVAQRLKLRRYLVWLLGARRFRQELEEVALDAPDSWPSDPSQVPQP